MSLTSKYWITPGGAIELSGREHEWLSTAVMLNMKDRMFAPYRWSIDGVPEVELDAALDRDADPNAVHFLRNPKNDSRLYAVREYGWVRTFKNKFNLWYFDCATADMDDKPVAVFCPTYSTAKYSQLERDRLYRRSGDNPRRKRR